MIPRRVGSFASGEVLAIAQSGAPGEPPLFRMHRHCKGYWAITGQHEGGDLLSGTLMQMTGPGWHLVIKQNRDLRLDCEVDNLRQAYDQIAEIREQGRLL